MGYVNTQLAREAAEAGIKRAVETGTLWGDGAMALSNMFERVETIELSRYYAMRAWLRLKWRGYRNVRVRCGDSASLLRPSKERTFYWLDAHWSGPSIASKETAGTSNQCPLLAELQATSPGTVGDWYLIDDARLFIHPAKDPFDPDQWPSIDDICSSFARLRPEYDVEVSEELDLILARPHACGTDGRSSERPHSEFRQLEV